MLPPPMTQPPTTENITNPGPPGQNSDGASSSNEVLPRSQQTGVLTNQLSGDGKPIYRSSCEHCFAASMVAANYGQLYTHNCMGCGLLACANCLALSPRNCRQTASRTCLDIPPMPQRVPPNPQPPLPSHQCEHCDTSCFTEPQMCGLCDTRCCNSCPLMRPRTCERPFDGFRGGGKNAGTKDFSV